MITTNKKLTGSNILECVPQVGRCSINCKGCFFNLYHKEYKLPIWPGKKEVEQSGKIVRINSVHDSYTLTDDDFKLLDYPRQFFNTCMPGFLSTTEVAPVVLTLVSYYSINAPAFKHIKEYLKDLRRYLELHKEKIMFIRLLVSEEVIYGYNLHYINPDIIEAHYKEFLDLLGITTELKIPTVATFLRYATKPLYSDYYQARMGTVHAWWMLKPVDKLKFMNHLKGSGLLMCGTLASSQCVDCGRCEGLYWKWRGCSS